MTTPLTPLQESVLKRIMLANSMNGTSVQKVLDSPYFRDLSLDDQIRFINENKEQLKKSPSFAWGPVVMGGAGLGAFAGLTALSHQLATQGGRGFKPNLWGIGASAVLGGLVGSGVEFKNSVKDQARDTQTVKSIDDAIGVLLSRQGRPAITRLNLRDRLEKDVIEMPIEKAKVMALTDFDQFDKK